MRVKQPKDPYLRQHHKLRLKTNTSIVSAYLFLPVAAVFLTLFFVAYQLWSPSILNFQLIEDETASITKPIIEPVQASIEQVKPLVTAQTEVIQKWVEKAQLQLKAHNLTRPKKHNAFASYSALKALNDVEADKQAQNILDAIFLQYLERGQDFIQAKRLSKAMKIYQTMQALQHDTSTTLHPNLTLLENALLKRHQVVLQQYIKQQRIQGLSPNAHDIYETMLDLNPNHENTLLARQTLIDILLQNAMQKMQKKHYTTPKNNNAHQYYRDVLKLAADNSDAEQGLNRIAQIYADIVRVHLEKKHYREADLMLKRGLNVQVRYPELLMLKQELARLKTAEN